MVFYLTGKQCSYFDALSPSHWAIASSATDFHSYEDFWVYESSPYDILKVMSTIEEKKSFKFMLVTNDDGDDDLYTTKYYKFSNILQFMSVVTITLTPVSKSGERSPSQKGGASPSITGYTEVAIKSCSASVFPAFLPLGFLLGIFLFWVPFPDFGANKKYVEELKAAIDAHVSRRKENIDSLEENNAVDASATASDGATFFLCFIVVPIITAVCYILFL